MSGGVGGEAEGEISWSFLSCMIGEVCGVVASFLFLVGVEVKSSGLVLSRLGVPGSCGRGRLLGDVVLAFLEGVEGVASVGEVCSALLAGGGPLVTSA